MIVLVKEDIIEAIKQAKNSEKRRFIQSIDLEIKLKGIDATKQENTFSEIYTLPKGLGSKKRSVCIIADTPTITKARESNADGLLTKEQLESLSGDKKSIRKLARKYDFFIADVSLMPLVGRIMGQILGPRNKIPVPLPPNVDPKSLVEKLRNSVRIKLKGQPVVRSLVGSEDMKEEDVTENVLALTDFVMQKIRGGPSSIHSLVIKLTMGSPVVVKSREV